jgi:hypothetical protein
VELGKKLASGLTDAVQDPFEEAATALLDPMALAQEDGAAEGGSWSVRVNEGGC